MTLFVAHYDQAIAVESERARNDIIEAVHDCTEAAEALKVAREARARGFDIQPPESA